MDDKNNKDAGKKHKDNPQQKQRAKPHPTQVPDVDDLIFADEIIKLHSEK